MSGITIYSGVIDFLSIYWGKFKVSAGEQGRDGGGCYSLYWEWRIEIPQRWVRSLTPPNHHFTALRDLGLLGDVPTNPD